MADNETPSAGSNAPPPDAPTAGDVLPSSADVELISYFERGAPDDGETR